MFPCFACYLICIILSLSFQQVPLLNRQNRSPSFGSRSGGSSPGIGVTAGGGVFTGVTGGAAGFMMPGRIRIPHTFMVHTYRFPTVCQYCKKLLKGLFKQGVQCRDCHYNAHKKCIEKVPQDCTGENQSIDLSDGAVSNERDSFFKDEFDDSDFDDTSFLNYSNRRNMEMPKINGNIDGIQSEPLSTKIGSGSPLSPSANIPLMRIVQSVKHTKKRGGQALKEGWLVHYTNLDKTVKRYFWRLDSKAITLFMADQGSKYHKEIPLSEILTIDTNKDVSKEKNHCFEIRTANVDYFVGQDPMVGCTEEPVRIPPPDSGIGTDIAKSWETSIRQAYMHVTNTRTYPLLYSELNNSTYSVFTSGRLCTPRSGYKAFAEFVNSKI